MASLYFVLCAAICLIAAISVIGSKYHLYGRFFVVLVISYGLLIKPLFVLLELPSKEFIADYVLYPLPIEEYWSGSVILLAYYGLFLLTMILSAHVLNGYKSSPDFGGIYRFRLSRVAIVVAVGLIGSVGFFYKNPEFLYGASKNILAATDLASYDGNGALRLLCSALYFVPFLMLINIKNNYKKRKSQFIFWGCALAWTAFTFLSDQRGAIIFSAISWLIAYNMFVKPLQAKYLISIGSMLVSMVLVRTAIRVMSDDATVLDSLDQILGNYVGRNFVENSKSLTIMKSVPELLPYAHGSSYLDSLLILIPRSIFVDKQTVNLDTIIGLSIFECDAIGACAVPPGLVAESYLNFGFVGLILMVIFAGWFTAWLDWKSDASGSLFKIFYASTFVYFGISALGSGISSFITLAVMDAAVLFFAFFISLNRVRFRTASQPSLNPKPIR